MAQRTFTGTIKAQLMSHYGPQDLQRDDETVMGILSLTNSDMSKYGYSVVGEATVTVTLHSTDQILGNKVDALRAEAKQVKAEAHAKCIEIERQVQQLLAITLDQSPQS